MLYARWVNAAPTLAERTRRRVAFHLIPWLFFLYILAFLDRANISVAKLGMEKSPSEGGLGFDPVVIGIGTGMFFWGYWILEIPSTVSVLKLGARWVFVRILVLWGLACTLIGAIDLPLANALFAWMPDIPEDAAALLTLDQAVDMACGWTVRLGDPEIRLFWFSGLANFFNELDHNAKYQFYFFRFMLGFFEGGFFPSVIVYLSLWFRARDRAKAIASFMAAAPLSLILGSPLSGLMLRIEWFDLPGWRWVFILQGIAPVIAGFATVFFLPDRPEKARWLPPEERDWLLGELEREHAAKKGQAHGHFLWLGHIWLVLLLTTAYFCLAVLVYGLTTFLPSILKQQTGLSDTWASVLTAVPYLLALAGMLVNGWHSDRSGERIGHVAAPLFALSLFLALASLVYNGPLLPVLLLILLIGTFMFAHLPAYWPIPSMFLGPVAFASAAGFINMIGNLGGSVGPVLVGASVKSPAADPVAAAGVVGLGAAHPLGGVTAAASAAQPPTYAAGLLILAAFPLTAAVIVVVIGALRRARPAAKSPVELCGFGGKA